MKKFNLKARLDKDIPISPVVTQGYSTSNYRVREHGSKYSTSREQSQDGVYNTPLHIIELVIQVLGTIDVDPCASDGKQTPARQHYTAVEGLDKEWNGHLFINPPQNCPGLWVEKLIREIESGRVVEAIALVPAATDTEWLSRLLETQSVCFWRGRIQFLDADCLAAITAQQPYVLVYWGHNIARFKEVFDVYGVVLLPQLVLTVNDSTVSTDYNNPSSETVLMVNDSTISTDRNNLSSETVLMVNGSTVSTDCNNPPSETVLMVDDLTVSTRRSRGEGTGRIQIRTITKKNGKQYQQAWYDWQIHEQACITSKSTYIPKHLLDMVYQLEQEKAPVRDILKVLGVQ